MFINLDHMITAERIEGEPGGVRITVVPGRTIDHSGPDADAFIQTLEDLAANPAGSSSTTIIHQERAYSTAPEAHA